MTSSLNRPAINQGTGITIYPVDFSPISTHDSYPELTERVVFSELVPYKLAQEVVDRIYGATLETLADIIWADPSRWLFLSEANLPREPYEWRVGDIVWIPTAIT